MHADPVPAITEAEATGEVAEIYADIRAALGIGVVNLIWRHLATIDGALPWVWRAVRPIYANGRAAEAGDQLFSDLTLPDMPPWPPAVLHTAGVADRDIPTVQAVLDSYNRGNATNLMALSTLVARQDLTDAGHSEPAPDAEPAMSPVLPAAEVRRPIPPLPALDALADDTRGLVMALTELGAHPGDRIVPSLYRHLAGWPGYLGLAWTALAPLHRTGRLEALGRQSLTAAAARAVTLAPPPVAQPENHDEILAAVEEFRRSAISRMVPIAMILRCMTERA